MSEMINPYIAGAPVTEAGMFFGREDVFSWIERSLPGRYVDHILVIHGQRRVGKTSVLKQLPHRLPDRYVPVFFDLQGRTHTLLDRFLWWLAREIIRVLKQDQDIVLPMPKVEDFTRDPEYLETQFLPNLRSYLGDRNLLLTFDEFDSLEEGDIKEALARPLIDHLRRLTGQERLNFIFSIGSSGRKLENMQASYTEFFKTALYKEISFLGKTDTYALITKPVEGILEYDPRAIERIFHIASGHPYFTQLICHELYSFFQRTGETRISIENVEAVLDDVVERGTVNLKFVWDEASDLEKWVLASLAHTEGRIDTHTLANALEKQRVRFSEQDLNSAILHMREKEVLTEDNRFVIHLMRVWLQKNRPLDRVREELVEVSPIASRYIEIGMEYKDIGQHDRAIESFQEALKVDPENLQAQVGVASVQLERGVYDHAVVEYEKALVIDEEDVAARSGLCEAHLAVGDQAFKQGKLKEAIRSYGQVLAINAEHTDARQRMADIHKKRAEQAVLEGRFDEAFSEFKEALQYTPEDGTLEARLTQIQEQYKSQLVEGLRLHAEKERTAKRWDQAIVLLDQALELVPEDEALREKLVQVRQAQQRDQLETLKENARRQAKLERWGEALIHWQAYLALQPEDRETVLAEIRQVEQEKQKSQTYREARQAMAGKDYNRAVVLLKEIVVEDETYKDASRLMAEAIELRRTARPVWKRKWLRVGIGGLTLVTVGLLLVWFAPSALQALGAPTKTPPSISELDTPPAVPMDTATPTMTPTSTPLPTPIPLAWARLSSGQFLPRDLVTAIVFDPIDPGVIYVGTADAGIYKSWNGGVSWQPVLLGLGSTSIDSLVIKPNDPRILYAGVMLGGVYKTSDGGTSWQAVNSEMQFAEWGLQSIVIMDPHDNEHLYYTHGPSLFESKDGGDSWGQFQESECPKDLWGLVFHPTNPLILFAADEGGECAGGVYQSNDGGITWERISDAEYMHELWIDNTSGSHLYTSSWHELYGSLDGGETWQRTTQEPGCTGFAFDPEQGAVAYCGTWNSQIATTADGGRTWHLLIQLDAGEIRGFSVSPHDTDMLLAGARGLFVSTDRGDHWIDQSSGLGGTRLDLKLDPSNPSILYAVESTGRGPCYRSTDAGHTWDLISSEGDGLAIAADGETLYRANISQILRSVDGGSTWTRINLPEGEDILSVTAHPYIDDTLYIARFPAQPPIIYVSMDDGETWQSTSGINYVMNAKLFFDHDEGQIIYAVGRGEVIRSNDGGKTWAECAATDFQHPQSDTQLAVHPQSSSRIFLATRGGGVLASQDSCQSWQSRNEGLGSLYVNTIAIDPENPDIVYAGTDGGAYVSFDGGTTWGEINDGLLGATVVYSIVIDPQSNVYAATPYGIFKLETK
jgi:photosystem II stability/assembly factor-like uncharacterized protein/tetratricopeptide (TPR) repeat protein